MKQQLRIGTRGSALALWQAEHVKAELERHYPECAIELKIIKTTGDKILDVPLAKVGGKGLFTKEIEEAMLSGEIDLAVHSLKDVPVEFPEGLGLSAITEREDVRDCFLSERFESLESLPQGAVVGSTSLRRVMQIRRVRPDLVCRSLRGNVQTRLGKLRSGEFDAIILATAGINRLGLWNEVPHVHPIPVAQMIPAMGQAALGIETRLGDPAALMSKVLEHRPTLITTSIERAFIAALEGGCQVPVGVLAELEGAYLRVRAIIGLPDGSEMLEDSLVCEASDYLDAGGALAEQMIAQGARDLLKRAEAMAMAEA